MFERESAPERRLAQQHHGARVPLTGGDLADRREPDGVARAFAEIGQRARDQIAFVDRVEQFDRACDLEPGAIRRGFRRRAQHEVLVAERARAIWP
jgi:hypothetical protein